MSELFGTELRQAAMDLAGPLASLSGMGAELRRQAPDVRGLADMSTRDGKRLVRAHRDAARDAERAARAVKALQDDLVAAADAADRTVEDGD